MVSGQLSKLICDILRIIITLQNTLTILLLDVVRRILRKYLEYKWIFWFSYVLGLKHRLVYLNDHVV